MQARVPTACLCTNLAVAPVPLTPTAAASIDIEFAAALAEQRAPPVEVLQQREPACTRHLLDRTWYVLYCGGGALAVGVDIRPSNACIRVCLANK